MGQVEDYEAKVKEVHTELGLYEANDPVLHEAKGCRLNFSSMG